MALLPRMMCLMLLVGVGACSDSIPDLSPRGGVAALDGEAVYAGRFADGNTFACATCHALSEPAADGLRRVAHPIGDAAARPSFKNGQYDNLLQAVNTCVTEWMVAKALGPDDERWLALRDFLEQAAPAQAVPITYQLTQPPVDLSAGDAANGMELFNVSCATCHAVDARGSERAPALYQTGLSRETIARRVRTSGPIDSSTYPGLTGGRMPFWGADRLSAAELLDVVAFVDKLGQLPRPLPVVPAADGDGLRTCDKTHRRVGQTAPLALPRGPTLHRVSGVVRIVDDCTVTIDQFSYDGNGIDVRIYAGKNGVFAPPTGFAISSNFVDRVYRGDEPFTFQLPDGITLDDLDGVSVWCVAVGADFGHALFP